VDYCAGVADASVGARTEVLQGAAEGAAQRRAKAELFEESVKVCWSIPLLLFVAALTGVCSGTRFSASARSSPSCGSAPSTVRVPCSMYCNPLTARRYSVPRPVQVLHAAAHRRGRAQVVGRRALIRTRAWIGRGCSREADAEIRPDLARARSARISALAIAHGRGATTLPAAVAAVSAPVPWAGPIARAAPAPSSVSVGRSCSPLLLRLKESCNCDDHDGA
jgi:hypothetical protein